MTTWAQIYSYAAAAGAKFPECVAAQWALESGYGKHTSGRNNYLGIKGTPGTSVETQEWVGGKFVTVTAVFKDFSTPQECIQYLVDKWYKDYQGYKGVNRATSADECASLLVVEGYATDPEYAKKLQRIMKENQKPSSKKYFLPRAAEHYKGLPHQKEALEALEDSLDEDTLKAFKAAYSPSQTPPTPSPAPTPPYQPKFPLAVPYYYQRDNATGQGERMCFSSAMAMAIEYLDPKALSGDDDDYLRVVQRYGDTVSSEAQLKAARSLGLDVTFHTNLTEQDLLNQLGRGIPVPIGILHKGSIQNPTGGGHWICLIGYDATNFYVHDPFGELDLVNGGYPKAGPTDGKNQRYTRKNLMRRWLIASKSDGWGMLFKG